MPIGYTPSAKSGANTDITSLAGHTVTGYTKLGTDAPAIKMKKMTGTTPAVGATGVYTTGIAKSKQLSLSVYVVNDSGALILPNHGIQSVAPEYYFAYINSDGDLVIHLPTESTAVDACAFTCVIIYEE